MSQHNEFRLDIKWTLRLKIGDPEFLGMKAIVQFRPWYDSDWQLSNEGQSRYQDASSRLGFNISTGSQQTSLASSRITPTPFSNYSWFWRTYEVSELPVNKGENR